MSSSHITKNLNQEQLIFLDATKDDYPFLNHLASDPYYGYAKSKDVFYDETGKSNVYSYMIYNSNQQFIGYIKGFYPVYYKHLWIQTLLINKAFSRQGYGSRIVSSFIKGILQIGTIDKTYLTCHQSNISGIHFWQSFGFQKTKGNIKSTNDLYELNTRSLLCNPKYLRH